MDTVNLLVEIEVLKRRLENAVEVVRCKECRHWRNEHICMAWSRHGTIETKSDGFCSYGERRE